MRACENVLERDCQDYAEIEINGKWYCPRCARELGVTK